MNSKVVALITGIVILIIVAGTSVVLLTDEDDGPETYNITYVLNGGTNSILNPDTYTEGDTIDFADASRDGYNFKGWYMESACINKVNGLSSEASGDLILYAGWTEIVINSYITYVMYGGTNSPGNPPTYVEGSTIMFIDPTKEGFVFDGWYLDDTFKTKTRGITSSTTGDVTVYANWLEAGVSYSITYDLFGGTNSPNNPSYYKSGTPVVLSDPTLDYHEFAGWFTDSNFTKQVTELDSNTTGDVRLYAGWNSHLAGHGYTTAVKGETVTFDKVTTFTGTYTWKYLYQNSDGYYLMESSYDVTYNDGTKDDHKSETRTYWTDSGSELTWTYGGSSTIDTVAGTKDCYIKVGTDENSQQTQYIGDGWILYEMITWDSNIGSTTNATYTFIEELEFQPEVSVDLNIYCDAGINVIVTGDMTPGSQIEIYAIVAEGFTFSGWFDKDDNLLSASYAYVIEEAVGMIEIYGANNDDPDLIAEENEWLTFNTDADISNIVWIIYDYYSLAVVNTYEMDTLSIEFKEAGHSYWITASGDDGRPYTYYKCFSVIVIGEVDVSYEWEYDHVSYNYALSIDYEDYLRYRNADVSRGQGTAEHDLQFVTYDDEYIVELAEYFMTETMGWSDLEIANFVLSFVHGITYAYDLDSMGVNEYWKYPLETLFNKCGDCEDLSILYAALTKAMDYDAALLLFSGHMAAGIYVTGCDGYCFPYGDTIYYFCETTSDEYSVGDNSRPLEYNIKTITIIPVV